MLTLYYKPTCPYSQQVLGEAEGMGVKFNLKDISWDQDLKDELMALGGKTQTPFLIDPQNGMKMYESEAIIAYLKEFHGETQNTSFGGLRVHQSEEICDTCQ